LLVIAGVHALGSLGAIDYLSRELPGVYAVAGARRFSMVVRSQHEGDQVVVAAKLLTKLGVADLAMLVADRCATAAVDAGSLSARGLAAYQAACASLQANRCGEAERLAVSMGEHG
jgi:hypothetical protein